MLQDNEELLPLNPDMSEARAQPKPELDPDLDFDAWFEQRDAVIEGLQAKRLELLEKVRKTEEQLGVLGIFFEAEPEPAPEPTAAKRRAPLRAIPAKRTKPSSIAPQRPSKGTTSPTQDSVLGTMSKKPEKIQDIAGRIGLKYEKVWSALNAARKRGLVRSTGEKGKDVRWALV